MQYTYRELQQLLKDARKAGFKCEYPLNSNRAALEEMYEDYCTWKQEAGGREEYSKEEDNYRSSYDSTVTPTWEEIVAQANKSYLYLYTWSYRRVQSWVRCLRDKHSFTIQCKLNANGTELIEVLRACFDIINGNEQKRKEREERRHKENEEWFNSYFSRKEANKKSFLINGVDIFSINVKDVGWLQPSQALFGTEANEIRRTWRNLALQHHPDHGGDKEIFQQLNTIHQRLVDWLR